MSVPPFWLSHYRRLALVELTSFDLRPVSDEYSKQLELWGGLSHGGKLACLFGNTHCDFMTCKKSFTVLRFEMSIWWLDWCCLTTGKAVSG